jgi:hypothetical protein
VFCGPPINQRTESYSPLALKNKYPGAKALFVIKDVSPIFSSIVKSALKATLSLQASKGKSSSRLHLAEINIIDNRIAVNCNLIFIVFVYENQGNKKAALMVVVSL